MTAAPLRHVARACHGGRNRETASLSGAPLTESCEQHVNRATPEAVRVEEPSWQEAMRRIGATLHHTVSVQAFHESRRSVVKPFDEPAELPSR